MSSSLLTGVAFFLVLLATVRPLGTYMDEVFAGRRNALTRVVGGCERFVYRVCRIDPQTEMSWKTYTFALLAVTVTSVTFVYVALRLQGRLPLNPQGFGNLPPDLAWNTAVSFATTTDWQFYSGESTMSYFSQMVLLAWQNFVAAAVGLAVAIALARGLARQKTGTIGNFWVDLTRGIFYVLLPLSIAFSLAFVIEGVPQNFHAYLNVATPEGTMQSITGGPMASQESIKLLGGNGGGFVGANSSSPNENPTAFTNFLQLLAMFLIPAALTYTFGRMVKDTRQGWAIFWAMSVLFVAGAFAGTAAELAGNPLVERHEVLLVILAILAFPVAILMPAAVAAVAPLGLATLSNGGPHGFSEILYAFTSSAASNGSAMGGLGVNTFYNITLGIVMLLARYGAIVPTLALAGAFGAKPRNDATSGTLRTDSTLFLVLLIANIFIVGALTFVPADALGPIVEHLLLRQGTAF